MPAPNDLFALSNGRWLVEYKIPADRRPDGAFRSLYDRAEEQVRDLITGPPGPAREEHRRAAHRRPVRQPSSMRPRFLSAVCSHCSTSLVAIDAAETPDGPGPRHRRLATGPGWAAGAGAYVDTDSKDSTRYLLHLSQSGWVCPTSPTTRRAARRDSGRLSEAHRRDVRLVYGGDHTETAARIVALETKPGRRTR